MNLVLFTPDEPGRPLPRTDRRVAHVLGVLQRGLGEPFAAGIFGGPPGRAWLSALDAATATFGFTPEPEPPRGPAGRLIVGLPRPQTARDVLRDATTLGVAALDFVLTEKGDPSYVQSTLWRSGEWRRHMGLGLEQAVATRPPEVTWGRALAEVLATLPAEGARVALDNYEAEGPLGPRPAPWVLAVGGERGWGPGDRAALRAHGFRLRHLGPRVLRTETACVAGISVLGAVDGA
ncbi:MAG: RNA methyltransferase [Verrucomicrobia bacterium]|nr:RNA methyltransferase [Verrucomicrobiota bacterium]